MFHYSIVASRCAGENPPQKFNGRAVEQVRKLDLSKVDNCVHSTILIQHERMALASLEKSQIMIQPERMALVSLEKGILKFLTSCKKFAMNS
jgi:hypothetical protein